MDIFSFMLIVLFGFLFNVLPWGLVLVSNKASGAQKLIWFLMAFCLSWLGFFVYYFLIIKPEWEKSYRGSPVARTETGIPVRNLR
ncbi:hypothetical protein tloyanaT_15390 [Thalassotalea loyana]|uniref:Cardiolipin synthase N-terminal domain-containing protein n=1 Tax=Thalassotalea loyana TaxID=280483 RepID=A0ABQ6HAZ7_9GAMM|nr:hypothetical protein [Thalassotalea loyana]GLX85287.1 hypothetical protein tloyanaT_15390 [Thalassotalea loyana]